VRFTAVIASLAAALLTVSASEARDATAADGRLDADRPRAVVAAGAAVQILQYQEIYSGFGLALEGGVDLPLFRASGSGHRLRLLGGALLFPAAATSLTFGSIGGGWRWSPAGGRGVHVGLATGATLSYERFDLELSGRAVGDSQLRWGIPFSGTFGWTLVRTFEIDLRYTQLVFVTDDPVTVGFAQLMIGLLL
jgi:hypothetical protein